MNTSKPQRSDEEWERLIAAAPDMLAALKETVGQLERLQQEAPDYYRLSNKQPNEVGPFALMLMARKAIAKAEGR